MKIDLVFRQAAGEDAATRAIIAARIELARKLDLEVVAEGVDTKAEWHLMRSLGVASALLQRYNRALTTLRAAATDRFVAVPRADDH